MLHSNENILHRKFDEPTSPFFTRYTPITKNPRYREFGLRQVRIASQSIRRNINSPFKWKFKRNCPLLTYLYTYIPQNVNRCPEHQQLIGIRGCERQGNEAGKRLLDIRGTKNKRKKRARSFALSRHRVSSTEVPASLGTRAIGWLKGVARKEKKRRKGKERKPRKVWTRRPRRRRRRRRRMPRKIAVARRRWSDEGEPRQEKKDGTNVRNYSVRTMFKCPTGGEISVVVGRKSRGEEAKDGRKRRKKE